MQTGNKGKNGKFAKGNKIGNRFQKGQSGNPNGRPKSAFLSDALRRKLRETMPDATEKTVADAVADALVKEALDGDVSAIREIFDRTEGKPLQTLDANIGVIDWRETLENYDFDENELLSEAERLLRSGDGDTESSGA